MFRYRIPAPLVLDVPTKTRLESSIPKFNPHCINRYATYLRAAGYHTGYFGKYLNPPAMDPYCHNKGKCAL